MSGVKGRSGGARKNSGGARPGAGRKPNPNSESHKIKQVRIEPGEQESFVYVIYEAEDPSIVKIGVAANVVSRHSNMQVGTWRRLMVGHVIKSPSKDAAHAIERQVHQALSALHVRGEWFRVSPDRAASEVDFAANQLRAAFAAIARVTEV